MQDKNEPRNDIIAGRNAVLEALKSGRNIDTLMVVRGKSAGAAGKIIAQCKEMGIPVKEVAGEKLDYLCPGINHQGVALSVAAHRYAELEELFLAAKQQDKPPFFILCDELEDPHNLGAIIRTAEAVGAHGIIIPKRRATGLTFSVAKASAGALEYMPVVRVSNLSSTIDDLKKRGVWIFGADMSGTTWCDTDFSGPVGLVIGSEGQGISRLVKEKCDFLVSLPMAGKINSLNASVAASILMYEIARQRMTKKQ